MVPATESAGLQAASGLPATEKSIEALAERGLDLSDHVTRSVEPALLERIDLALGMTRRHVELLAALAAGRPLRVELFDPAGRILTVVPEQACRRFVTIDPAGTSADKQRESRGRPPSWTVVQVWDQPPRELARFLLLREQVRERVAFDGLVAIVRTIHARWLPQRIWIEDEKLGNAAVSILQREGLPIETIRTSGRDKLTRASELILKMERGEIFLPRLDNRWRPAFEAELLAWTGLENQPSDQIDAAAYAAIIASQHDPSPIRIQPVVHRS